MQQDEEPVDAEAAAAAAVAKAERLANIAAVNKEQLTGTSTLAGKAVALLLTVGSFAFALYAADPNVCSFFGAVKEACIVPPS